MRLITLIIPMLLLLCSISIWAQEQPAAPPPSPTATTPAEAELGKDTAKQFEKDFKLVQDEKMIAKLNAMAAEIAPYTQRPDVKYTCKIVDSNAINAMAIPGGTIYFMKGLLNAVESDHEIAAVMAHEIAHNSLFHSKRMMERERKASFAELLGMLALIYVNDTSHGENGISPMEMLTVSEVVKQAILNGYSVDLETEADLNAVQYLHATKKYDPVGLYSVMLGFRQMEELRANIDLGYIKTHPNPVQRIHDIKKKFDELKIPINLWNVVGFRAQVISPAEGKTGYIVRLGNVDAVTFIAADGDQDALARANAATEAINERLLKRDAEIQRFEVRATMNEEGTIAYIQMRNTIIMTLTKADAGTTSLSDFANLVKQNIQLAIFNEKVKRGS